MEATFTERAGVSRRSLFATVSTVIAAVALAGCDVFTQATTQISGDAQQITDDVNAVAAGLNGLIPNVTGITSAANSIVTDIKAGVTKIQGFAASVTSAVKTGVQAAGPYINAALGVVGTIGGDITGLSSAGVTVPTWITDVISAAKVVLPAALSLAGVALAPPPGLMTLTQARYLLKAAAAGTAASANWRVVA